MAKGAGKNIDATKGLWLENLPEEATWTEPMELGQQVGAPTWAEKTSESRGYLLFETAYQATTAMQALHGAFVGHNEIEVWRPVSNTWWVRSCGARGFRLYHNTATGQTTRAPQRYPPEAQISREWWMARAHNGMPYYFNTTTKQITWVQPEVKWTYAKTIYRAP